MDNNPVNSNKFGYWNLTLGKVMKRIERNGITAIDWKDLSAKIMKGKDTFSFGHDGGRGPWKTSYRTVAGCYWFSIQVSYGPITGTLDNKSEYNNLCLHNAE